MNKLMIASFLIDLGKKKKKTAFLQCSDLEVVSDLGCVAFGLMDSLFWGRKVGVSGPVAIFACYACIILCF